MTGDFSEPRSSGGRACLKRQTLECLLFVAVGLVGYVCLEGVNYLAVRSGDGFGRSVEYYLKAGRIDGLVLGDSHPAYDIDPALLGPRWHNFAYPGENWVMSYFKLKYVLDQGQRPSYVVLPLDYHSFSFYRLNGADYSNYLDLDQSGELRKAIGIKAVVKGVAKAYLPLTSSFNRQQLVEYVMKRLKGGVVRDSASLRSFAVSPNGHLVSLRSGFSTKSSEERTSLARARYREQMKSPLVNPMLVEYFRRILALCEDHDILIIGIRFPLSEPYAKLIEAHEEVKLVEEVYARERSRFAMIQNYEKRFLGRVSYFNDADHLNAEGSGELSRELGKNILPPSVLAGQ